MEGARVPWEWTESRLCEEFHCLPSQLRKEDPLTIMTIAHMRGYVDAKQTLDTATKESDVKRTPMMDTVWEIQLEIMQDRKAKRGPR